MDGPELLKASIEKLQAEQAPKRQMRNWARLNGVPGGHGAVREADRGIPQRHVAISRLSG